MFPIQWRYAKKAQADESWLLQKRFGHFNFHGLKILQLKNKVRDLPMITKLDGICKGCMFKKQHQ